MAGPRILFNTAVPMRDGVKLSADIYLPDGEGRHPGVLLRTPYNKNSDAILRMGRLFSSHGYAFVAMDVRGRGDSDGTWVPYRAEGADGYDSIEWCAQQTWSTGRIGTIGQSYAGYAQWLAAIRQPPHLTAMLVMTTMGDPFEDVWIAGPGGVPTPTMISWYHLTAGRVLQNQKAVDWEPLNWHLPLYTMDLGAGRGPNPLWRSIIDHSRRDAWWDPLRYQDQLAKVRVPVLHISGWYDDALGATPKNFRGMRAQAHSEEVRGAQQLLIGPWPHALNSASRLGNVDFGPKAVIDLEGEQIRFFDRWLKGTVTDKPTPARLFVMGRNEWIATADYPLPETQWTRYYLHSAGRANSLHGDGRLTPDLPGDEPQDRYHSDPENPVPFLTEPSFAQLGGPDDYRPVERRDDVLVYTSDPMPKEMIVCGPVEVHLQATSSAPDTDFMAKLLDVWPSGYAQRLNDGMVRARFRNGFEKPEMIVPGTVYGFDIDLWDTCQAFAPGHRVRVEISSSAFPKYDRNPNTDEAPGKGSRLAVAHQTVFHDGKRPSYVVLPIVSLGAAVP